MTTKTTAKKSAAKTTSKAAKAPAKKAAAPKRKEAPVKATKGTPVEQADAAIAKLDEALERSKKRLAPKADAPKPAKAAKAPAAPKAAKEGTYAQMQANRKTTSSVENPVRAMWDLCDKMTGSRRKDVIAAAVEAGINYYTARTQYQLWLTAYNNDNKAK